MYIERTGEWTPDIEFTDLGLFDRVFGFHCRNGRVTLLVRYGDAPWQPSQEWEVSILQRIKQLIQDNQAVFFQGMPGLSTPDYTGQLDPALLTFV